jgi:citrate synthase
MSSIVQELKQRIQASAAPLQEKVKNIKNSDVVIQQITVEQCIGGMRGIKGLLTETSELDAIDGIRYRGVGLYEVCKVLPKSPGADGVALPEGAFWMLLTGEVPKPEQVAALTKELHVRSKVPDSTLKMIDTLPKDMHPMTQLSIAIMLLQPGSKFYKGYSDGTMKKNQYWEHTLEDGLTMIAQMPVICARIYQNVYKGGKRFDYDEKLDFAGNYAKMLGVTDDEKFKDALRLYFTLHADHEGGPVSAHTAHLVGSALSDPYLALSAGVNGLAGPLHGLANQECLLWLNETMKEMGSKPITVESVTEFAKKTLSEGKVIPGFGHAVLRNTDPRYVLEHDFAKKNMPNDPTFKLADACKEAIPPVLKATGKAKNPWPNVDALSGTILKFYGLTQADYYTVVFAISRGIGIASQLVWARLLSLPIERPKSLPTEALVKAVANAPPKSKL